MEHDKLARFARENGQAVIGRLRTLLQQAEPDAPDSDPALDGDSAPVQDDEHGPDPAAPPVPVRLGARLVRPFEGESNAAFQQRIAWLKADMLRRALKDGECEREPARMAVAVERAALRAVAALRSEATRRGDNGHRPGSASFGETCLDDLGLADHPWSVQHRKRAKRAAAESGGADATPSSEASKPSPPTQRAPSEPAPPPEPKDDLDSALDRVFG